MESPSRVTRSNPGTPVASGDSSKAMSLKDIMKQGRKKNKSTPKKESPVKVLDPYAPAIAAKEMVRGETGLVYDEFMAKHANPWDSEHIECPDRLLKPYERCQELGLIEKCLRIPSRKATLEEILLCHNQAYIDQVVGVSSKFETPQELKEFCEKVYHSVYINEFSAECAKMAAGSAIELTKAILDGQVQNGIALLRPPGHHAQRNVGNGFCLFNNVAIAANWALKEKKAEKIMIVDIDVHHGQASQYEFYDNPNVLYFSIHRYENGLFWPNLRESNYDYIGGPDDQPSAGKNVNVPLNKIGLGDSEYLAIFQQVLLPMAYEFNPDIILVSAGFDAALGCPEGQMRVTPAAYGHLINGLMSFANGRVGVFLEGGYFINSLKEGVAMTLRALLGEPCIALGALPPPDDSIVETLLNLIAMQKSVWQSLNLQETFNILTYDVLKELDCHVPALIYKGKDLYEASLTGASYEVHESKNEFEKLTKEMDTLRSKYQVCLTRLSLPTHLVGLVYDEAMMNHINEEESHPEDPMRIKEIFKKHEDYGLLERKSLTKLASRKATNEELALVHDQPHIDDMKAIEDLTQAERNDRADKYNSIYFSQGSYNSSLLATGSLLNVMDAVCNEEVTRGVAIIRPPGHHAEADEACGFCLFNNVSVAAKYGLEMHSLKRILILDWDVHHGNGIQHMFYNDPRVLYISIHRFDGGTFFPGKDDADHDRVGEGAGKGYNINVAWNGSGMGDPEYALAFYNLILPVAYQFNPDLVLVSSGFDAARGDPLGRCKVSPEFYGHMTNHLKALANGKIIVALEGGYNLNAISLSMTMVTKALLGDPLPTLAPYTKPLPSAFESVKASIRSLAPYWSCLKFGLKKLPDDMTNIKKQMVQKVQEFIEENPKAAKSDYIPSQFGAYVDTFSVNTLSDIKVAYTKEFGSSTIMSESKSYKPKKPDDVADQLGSLSISNQSSSTATSSTTPVVVSDREIYIPEEVRSFALTSGCYTMTTSRSKPAETVTTDSKRDQN